MKWRGRLKKQMSPCYNEGLCARALCVPMRSDQYTSLLFIHRQFSLSDRDICLGKAEFLFIRQVRVDNVVMVLLPFCLYHNQIWLQPASIVIKHQFVSTSVTDNVSASSEEKKPSSISFSICTSYRSPPALDMTKTKKETKTTMVRDIF